MQPQDHCKRKRDRALLNWWSAHLFPILLQSVSTDLLLDFLNFGPRNRKNQNKCLLEHWPLDTDKKTDERIKCFYSRWKVGSPAHRSKETFHVSHHKAYKSSKAYVASTWGFYNGKSNRCRNSLGTGYGGSYSPVPKRYFRCFRRSLSNLRGETRYSLCACFWEQTKQIWNLQLSCWQLIDFFKAISANIFTWFFTKNPGKNLQQTLHSPNTDTAVSGRNRWRPVTQRLSVTTASLPMARRFTRLYLGAFGKSSSWYTKNIPQHFSQLETNIKVISYCRSWVVGWLWYFDIFCVLCGYKNVEDGIFTSRFATSFPPQNALSRPTPELSLSSSLSARLSEPRNERSAAPHRWAVKQLRPPAMKTHSCSEACNSFIFLRQREWLETSEK